MAPTLTNTLEKLSGSRPFFRHLKKKPRWTQVTASITGHLLTYSTQANPNKTLLLVPATARLCSYSEQLSKKRPHLFRLKAVPEHAHRDQHPHIIFFSAPSRHVAEQWVLAANKAALDAVLPDWTPLDAPVLAAWGHLPEISISDLPDVLQRLNFKLPIDEFTASFEQIYAKSPEKQIHVREFIAVILHLVKGGPVLSAMLQDVPPEGLTSDQLASAIMSSPEHAVSLLTQHNVETCSPRLLLQILFDESNSIIDPEKAAAPHDMTRPLNEYIISSSHNTYLTGDQLRSESTSEMYRIVLEKGCRCVEIDMWDGDEGFPVVTHGHTITSSEPLEDIIRVIAEHSFSHGYDYPVILSLENHLSYEQQILAGNMMKDILGNLLLIPELVGREQDSLPCPESMKKKILIKAKTGRSVLRSNLGQLSAPFLSETAGLEDEDSEEEDQTPTNETSNQSKRPFKTVFKKRSSGGDSAEDVPSSNEEKPERSKVAAAIANIVFLSGGNRKSLMELWKQGVSGKKEYLAASCVSLSEKKIEDVLVNELFDQIREYNSHGLTRVYPKATRVDSSNYISTLAHYLGCQLVALNWQGEDTGLAINEARFLCNRGCGYVLSKSVVEPALPGVLEFEFLSGFLLPRGHSIVKSTVKTDIIDSYCSLKLYDETFSSIDELCSFKFETTVVRSNGFAPVWQQLVQIPVKNRALSVLIIKVYDHDRTSEDDFIGYCPIPVALLREGVRCCPLKSKEGNPVRIAGTTLRPSILCKVKWA